MSESMNQKWSDAAKKIHGFPKYKIDTLKKIDNLCVNKHQEPLNDVVLSTFKAIMEIKNINQSELAKRMNVTRSNISLIFTGKHYLNLRTIESISEALGGNAAFVFRNND